MKPTNLTRGDETVLEKINAVTAYAYSDRYSILGPSPMDECVGCEHNQEEADALVAWLNNQRGGGYRVRRNTLDEVRAARVLFHPKPFRYPHREEAFREIGIW